MRYLTDIRDQVYNELIGEVGSDFEVEKFWSEDVNELIDHVLDNEPRIDEYPHLFVVCPTVETASRRAVPTDMVDNVSVRVWVVSEDSYEENRNFYSADEAALLTRAFLSKPRFGTSFSSEEPIDSFTITEEVTRESVTIYSVTGILTLDIDNQTVINNYTS